MTGLMQVIASIAMMFLMHGAYKYVNARLATVSRLISMTPELTLPPFGRRCLSPLTPAIRVSVS
jgi:hypothetical protein